MIDLSPFKTHDIVVKQSRIVVIETDDMAVVDRLLLLKANGIEVTFSKPDPMGEMHCVQVISERHDLPGMANAIADELSKSYRVRRMYLDNNTYQDVERFGAPPFVKQVYPPFPSIKD